jgi:hypothetical protein
MVLAAHQLSSCLVHVACQLSLCATGGWADLRKVGGALSYKGGGPWIGSRGLHGVGCAPRGLFVTNTDQLTWVHVGRVDVLGVQS